MTTPARTPQPHRPEVGAERRSAAGAGPPGKPGQANLVVQDQPTRRIRRPVDALRCLADLFWIGVLVVAGLAARATTQGVETDLVDASRRLQDVVLPTLRGISLFGLLAFTVALAVRQLVRRQSRRLAEAVATGAGTIALVLLANLVLRSNFDGTLYRAIAMAPPGTSGFAPLDAPLAGLVAFTTIIDLSGRTRWRVALWLTVGVYLVTSLADLRTSVLSVLITLLVGRVIALAVRYVAGSPSQRPPAAAIAAALGSADQPVTEMRRVPVSGVESRRYAAVTPDGGRLDVTVFDRDRQAAGLLSRLYRLVRLRDQVARRAPLSTERLAERRALLAYAVEDAGVRTPRLRAVLRVGPEAMALAYRRRRRHVAGPAGQRGDRRGSGTRVGRGAPAARAPGHPPVADRGQDRHLPGRPDQAARPGRRRHRGQRPAAAPGPGPAAGRAGHAGRPGPGRRPGAAQAGRGRAGRAAAAAAAGGAGPVNPDVPAPEQARAAGAAVPRLLAIDPGDGAGRAAGPAGAGPAAQPDHSGGQHPGRLPADFGSWPGST